MAPENRPTVDSLHCLKLLVVLTAFDVESADPELVKLLRLASVSDHVVELLDALADPQTALGTAAAVVNADEFPEAAAACSRAEISITRAALLAPRIIQALGAFQ